MNERVSDAPPNTTLDFSPEQMRAIGYQFVDRLVDHMSRLREMPVARRPTRAEMESLLREPIPERPTDIAALLDRLDRDVFSNISLVNHPRFFAFVPGPGNFISAMTESLAAGVNSFVGTWLGGAASAEIELVTIDWLRQLCGLPETAGGLFTSGGSMANLTALAVARHARNRDRTAGAAIYCSDQTHSSLDRGVRALGFAPSQFRKIASDAEQRLSVESLAAAVEEDRRMGRAPFCVIANAGTTNTGAVDPLDELADFCAREEMWLHADGAYGAAAVLCDRGRAALAGLDRVDSLTLDPHKWLFQPFEIGCVIVRDRRLMAAAFHNRPEYLKDVARSEEEICFTDYGLQLSRCFRALKLWMTFKVFGLEAIRAAVARGFALADLAESKLRATPDVEIVTPSRLAVVTFRFAPPGMSESEIGALNHRVMQAMMADGYAMLTSTVIRGREVLRICTINPRTTDADIEETVARLARFAERERSAASTSVT
jgi:glutamate/tyrosine decarboxylase-like PLP-dependent enzyme